MFHMDVDRAKCICSASEKDVAVIKMGDEWFLDEHFSCLAGLQRLYLRFKKKKDPNQPCRTQV